MIATTCVNVTPAEVMLKLERPQKVMRFAPDGDTPDTKVSDPKIATLIVPLKVGDPVQLVKSIVLPSLGISAVMV